MASYILDEAADSLLPGWALGDGVACRTGRALEWHLGICRKAADIDFGFGNSAAIQLWHETDSAPAPS